LNIFLINSHFKDRLAAWDSMRKLDRGWQDVGKAKRYQRRNIFRPIRLHRVKRDVCQVKPNDRSFLRRLSERFSVILLRVASKEAPSNESQNGQTAFLKQDQ
jgi:hypothetical protein